MPQTQADIDVAPIGDIAAASETIRIAEAKQREAVQLARARGISWNVIAVALGVSRQAARQRFAKERIDKNTGLAFISNSHQQTERRDD